MPKKSEEFEIFDGANELFRRFSKGEITQGELREKLRPVKRLMKLLHKLSVSLNGIINLDVLHKKGMITDSELTEGKRERIQDYEQAEKEARRMAKVIRKNASRSQKR